MRPVPYYQDDQVTLYCGDCRDVLRGLELAPDHQLTDPPFSAKTHEGARTMKDRGAAGILPYSPITIEDLRLVWGELARPKRWIVATVEDLHAYALDPAMRLTLHMPEFAPGDLLELCGEAPPGVDFVRHGIWDKGDTGAPQISGDRPGTGWEAVVHLHTSGAGRMRWNGGGRRAVYRHQIARGSIPEEKPFGLLAEWVRLFTDAGELLLDPWCGHGTTLRAAKDLGRRAVGIEIDEERCRYTAERMRQEGLFTHLANVPPVLGGAPLLDVPRNKRLALDATEAAWMEIRAKWKAGHISDEEAAKLLEPVRAEMAKPEPCLDPDKMHGAGDGQGGSDY